MKAVIKLAIVLLSLVSLGFSTAINASELVFADKKDSKKNQKIDNKVDCEIDIDHNKNSVVGPNNQLCDNDSISLIDSTLIQSSPDNGNGDNIAPRVLSVDPQDGENNVSLNTEIKVTFDRTMDQDTLDDGSLRIFNLDTGADPGVNANPSAMSVTYTLDRQLEPGTRYEAELDFDIQDVDGNNLDCTNSNAVDSSCRWQFETTGTSGSASIELSPTSGSVDSSVHITGTGFDPNREVTVTFDSLLGKIVVATGSTNNNGEFSDDFTVPVSIPGPHTVVASDGSTSDSATFTVTSATDPIIAINPTSGPNGTSVNITGINFDPNSDVTITFAGNPVTTSPPTVTTNNNGVFSANFIVPTSPTGDRIVSATDGDNSDSATFEVTQSLLGTNQQLDTNQQLPPATDNSIATQGILPF